MTLKLSIKSKYYCQHHYYLILTFKCNTAVPGVCASFITLSVLQVVEDESNIIMVPFIYPTISRVQSWLKSIADTAPQSTASWYHWNVCKESNKIVKPLLVPMAIRSENLIALGWPASKRS